MFEDGNFSTDTEGRDEVHDIHFLAKRDGLMWFALMAGNTSNPIRNKKNYKLKTDEKLSLAQMRIGVYDGMGVYMYVHPFPIQSLIT